MDRRSWMAWFLAGKHDHLLEMGGGKARIPFFAGGELAERAYTAGWWTAFRQYYAKIDEAMPFGSIVVP